MNEFWKIFFTAAGGTGAVVAVCGWPITIWLKKKIEADVQSKYDMALKKLEAKNAQELEGFKAGYKKVLDENQIRFSEYHIKRVKYIEKCFELLVDAHVATFKYCDQYGNESNNKLNELKDKASNAYKSYYVYFQKKEIFMDEKTAENFTKCFRNIQKAFSSKDWKTYETEHNLRPLDNSLGNVRKSLEIIPESIQLLRQDIKQELIIDSNTKKAENGK